LRGRWHAWADAWARDFSELCRAQGFVPAPALRQRTLFEEVVVPLATSGGGGSTVVFLVDALRYEMAEALREALSDASGVALDLRARLAELPSITAVGMNALAPLADRGRLRPVIRDGKIEGLAHGEFQVLAPEQRRRAMQDRVGGTKCPLYTLAEVQSRDVESLRHGIAGAKLVVVHVDAIDSAGEKGNGLMVFEQVLQSLRAAWNLLREAGARRFVFTADHGFLLLDDTVRVAQSHGRKIDPWRRHALSPFAEDNRDEVRVPLAQLEYEDPQGLHLMMPEGTAVFDVGRRSLSFVHGGGSLQERVIPVLTVVQRGAGGGGGDTLTYALSAKGGQAFDEWHCVSGQIEMVAEQHALNFGGKKEIELALRALGEPDVQIELRQARGGASVRNSAIFAQVGEGFELFFKLVGPQESRVQLEL
ncbi:MAG: BREX-6 system phosphatase PglZ, partial [Myxococcales bacterium]|nr:BREX-6 system phosphatase PglZ [Myxococcales bacterium]